MLLRISFVLRAIVFLVALQSHGTWAKAATWDDPANFLFTSGIGTEVVTVINVADNTIVGQIDTGYPIDDIAASGFGDYAFASHAQAKIITVINLRDRKIEAQVPVSIKPRHLTFEQNSGLVVTDSVEGGMVMLDTRGTREIYRRAATSYSAQRASSPTIMPAGRELSGRLPWIPGAACGRPECLFRVKVFHWYDPWTDCSWYLFSRSKGRCMR